MSPQFVDPPSELGDFPSLEFVGELWRIHGEEREPSFFNSSGSGRFDLLDVRGRGTCYLSSTPAGAFVEVFGDMLIVPRELVARKRLSRAVAADKLRLANVTDPLVIGRYGLGQEISSNLDYGPTQRWATALHANGFDGIWYSARHDPSGVSRSIAAFGQSPFDADRFTWTTFDLPQDGLLEEVAMTYGIEVLRAPR